MDHDCASLTYKMESRTNGDRSSVQFGWKQPDGRWIRASFLTEWVAYDSIRDRWLGILRELVSPLDDIPMPIANPIRALIHSWVYVPAEGRNGMTLPLKLDTLRGKPRFFHKDDPRLKLAEP